MTRYYLLFLFAVLLAGFGQIVLKKAALKNNPSLIRQYFNVNVMIGYILFLISMGIASIAYRGMPLKATPALDSMGFVIVPALSFLFLGEKITRTKVFGFFLIACGVLIFIL